MQIVFAAFTLAGGLIAALAGVYGLRQTRRIARSGHFAIALVKPVPPGAERVLLAFETADGRLMEIPSPVPLAEGRSIRLAYDPGDPRDVVVDGHRRTGVDGGFVVAGAMLTAIGIALALSVF